MLSFSALDPAIQKQSCVIARPARFLAVIPAKAGIQAIRISWIPVALANASLPGMTFEIHK
jgi:hypothetical protein